MVFKCPCGHENSYTFEFWRKNKECPVCASGKINLSTSDKPPKKKDFRVLAFDQAIHTSGWSVFDGEELIKYGHHTSNGNSVEARLSQTRQWVINMIYIWNPDLITFEDIQLQRSDGVEQVITYKKLAWLQGVLFNYCYENGFKYKVVSPSTWRSFNKIKGSTKTDKKRNAQFKIEQLFNVSATQDEAEAVLIGRWAALNQQANKIIMF